jgi:AcrR family transcriptional regulator
MSEVDETGVAREARLRLVEAMAAVVAEKGYPATTIADIVARARVSRRTFYEEFADNAACLLACHEMLGQYMLQSMSSVEVGTSPSEEFVRESVGALLRTLAAHPNLTYAYFAAMRSAGLTTSPARRAVQINVAAQLQHLAAQAQQVDDRIQVPTPMMAAAVVAGIGELIIRSVEQRAGDLDAIAPTVVDFVSAVLMPLNRS